MSYTKTVVLTLALLLAPGVSFATDYKDWLPHLPDTLDGMKAVSNGEGMNLSTGSGTMSTLNRSYKDGAREINISISHIKDTSRSAAPAKPLEKMTLDNGVMVMKTVKIQGFDAFYQYMKAEKDAQVTVTLDGNSRFMLATGGGVAKGEKHVIGLFDKINLKKIAASF